MIIRTALQRVQSQYSAGVQSDDSRLANRHIYNVLTGIRSQLLTQEHKKGQRVSDFAYQSLPCIELEIVADTECPCAVPTGCRLLKSRFPIPSLMVGHSKNIFRLSGMGGQLSFTETTLEDKKYKSGNKYTRNKPDFFLRSTSKGVFLYVTVTTSITNVSGLGLFNEPLQAYLFPNLCDPIDKCKSYLDYEFPFEDDLMQGLIDLAAVELIQNFTRSKEDIRNDGKSSQVEG